MSKRCLVTGGAGFIGSHIVERLLAEGASVGVLDDLSTGRREYVPKEAKLYVGDVRKDLDAIFEETRPEVVFHEAAQVSVSVSVREPKLDADINVLGLIQVLETCRRFGVKRVIYASSAAGYGEPQEIPMTEEHSLLSVSPYGITKLVAERYLYCYRQNFGIDFVALRYANVFGPRQDPHGEAGVVAIFSEKLLSGEAPTIFGDGQQTRDFVSVDDVARANILAMNADLPGDVLPVFNISTARETTVNELFGLIQKSARSEIAAIYADPRPGDPYRSALANAKAREHLGFEPQVSLADGVEKTVAFFRDRSR